MKRTWTVAASLLVGGCMAACASQTAPTAAQIGSARTAASVGQNRQQPFELSQGHGLPVCEAYVKMLQAGPPIRASAECDSSPTTFQGIAAFDLNVKYGPMSEELVDQIVDFLWERDVNPAWYFGRDAYASWRAAPDQLRAAKQGFRGDVLRRMSFGLRQARIDIDNDGSAEQIVYLARSICSDAPAMPIVLTGDGQAIDKTKTAILARHPIRSDPRWHEARTLGPTERAGSDIRIVALPDAFNSAQYVFFSFASETYFALRWYPEIEHALDAVSPQQREVYLARHGQVKQICAIDFHRKHDAN